MSDLVPLREVGAVAEDLVGMFARTLAATGVLVLLLSAMGLYALVSCRWVRRGREIGLRFALGARRSDLVALVARDALRPLALGAVLGLSVVLVAARARWLDRMFDVVLAPAGPWVVPAVVAVLMAAGIAACWLPASRALRIAPQEVLQLED